MKIDKINLVLDTHKQELCCENNLYKFKDVQIEVLGGKINVTAESTPICGIEIIIDNTYFNDAHILGDTFERAYGDLGWKKEYTLIPWYFFAEENDRIFGFGVKTLPNAICTWQCNSNIIVLKADVRNGQNPVVLNGRMLEACEIVHGEYDNDGITAMIKFCRLMCDNPKNPDRPVYGGNDWYCNYGDNSFEKIIKHTKRIVECSPKQYKPYMVIDDGWQLCHQFGEGEEGNYNGGPWRYANYNFVDMQKMAQAIEAEGALPGLWFRPLLTIEAVPDEYVLKTKFGLQRILDPSYPDVLNYIKDSIITFKKWGYKLLKHDFSTYDIFGKWGFQMTDFAPEGISFYDKSKTTAEIIKGLYYAIREAAGEDILLLGCNTISHLSAGIFDIQRTGDDTSGIDWERTKKYGINTLAFRMSQHNTFYAADADCVGITDKIEWKKNRQWLDVLAKSGTPLFVSIADNVYTDEIREDIAKAFEYAVNNQDVSVPIDWRETPLPTKWRSSYGIDEYEW